MDRLLSDMQFIKGVGPKRSKQLQRLGIDSVFDLFWNVPRAYVNRSNSIPVAQVEDGQAVTIRGVICSTATNRTRKGMVIFKALVQDDSGVLTAVWFNQPFMKGLLQPEQEIFLSGKAKLNYDGMQLLVSEYDIIGEEKDSDIFPVYALTEGLNQRLMRSLTLSCLKDYLRFYPELFNEELQQKYKLCSIESAFRHIHYPAGREAYREARRRLAVEELVLFQLKLAIAEKSGTDKQYVVHQEKDDLVRRVAAKLPFELTPAQQQAWEEIFADMEAARPMNRLLQGDVGAGKTVVALLAMTKAVSSGFQAALMAPTEILAEQHYRTVSPFLDDAGLVVARLSGGTPAGERRLILEAALNGKIDVLIGTHALIQNDVVFKNLGLIIIDEQHRFGVRQRAALGNKGTAPDILVMTATPIPRTLALTVYGDLDLSLIDQLPPGRKPIKTHVIKPEQRLRLYRYVHEQACQGIQAYIVCPLVEESEKQDMQAAVSLYEELKSMFTDIKIGLVHGRLKSGEKDLAIRMFKDRKFHILVSTSVIEVGVDIPDASIMVIEQAERFGLSQLHQLRGRVGRSHLQSYCFLIADPHTEEARQRLQAIASTSDGFQLAEEDLKIRGPGEFWGVRQHGLVGLKVANLVKDQKLVQLSRQLARELAADNPDIFIKKYINLKFEKGNQVAPN